MEREAVEAMLREKARRLLESISVSETARDEAAAAFASMDRRMAAVDEAMRPAQARTWSACKVHDNVVRSLRAAEAILKHLDDVHQAEPVILNGPSKGLTDYLYAVDKLRGVVSFFTSKRSCAAGDEALKNVDQLLSKAGVELEGEFSRVLSKCSKPVELEPLFNCLPSHSSAKDASEGQTNPGAACSLPTLVDPRYMSVVSKLVQKSAELGRHKQFMKIYRDIRSSTLELTLKQLGVEYVTTEEVQTMQVESLDAKVAHWIQCLQIAVKLLFPAERVLCDQIFEGQKGHCFAAATSKSLLTLLSFGEAIAKSETSPEKVFMLLDMFNATLELQSEVEVVFQGDECSGNRKSAMNLVKCLARMTKRTLGEFRDNILKDSPKSMTTDGDVHPLTSYVGNYIKFLFDYQSSLKLIFQESSIRDGTNSRLVAEITGLIHALETNLDVKAKQYKNHALGNLFLMNNIHYIVRCICSSEFKDVFGDDWIQRHRRVVQQHATQYRRVTWGKAVECLSSQGLTSSAGSATEVAPDSVANVRSFSGTTPRSVIKARFRSFNKQFEEVCQTQINWAIPDIELHDNLILMIAEILLPAYRSFLKRYRPFVENSHNASKYIKYTPEALEQALGNLFVKKPLSEQGH
ncbi:exocyst complex component EXO70A1-like isoform X2 [Brachypodium distachyon]|uniref:Exocyst subunit Exo70 family protein n=1 Tax=Brachypodium distachyon TaxID=15368 RepID=A0A0Q3ECB8_BRADI|nr:exocyst complex component EXO70A1-like isoform X2 [Brachypodium distachyon]KQJ85365.1 hypothetical protein BRADI_5g26587v3 [Brachypodium distachyon]|eukprot:XP_024311404.1 exocyst complex component EXO70A1-like isoform X2 [Brachypodium distachyon]